MKTLEPNKEWKKRTESMDIGRNSPYSIAYTP